MRVHTLLPQTSLGYLEAALGVEVRTHSAFGVDEFAANLRAFPFGLLIVDPDMVERSRMDELVSLLALRRLRVVIYTAITSTSAHAIGMLARSYRVAVIIRGFDDTPLRFVQMLDVDPPTMVGSRVVERLATKLDALPIRVRRGVVSAFCARAPIYSVIELAQKCGTTRRSIDRSLGVIGLRPAKSLLAASHLLRAYSLLDATTESTLGCAARSSGFGTVKAMNNNFVRFTGALPRQLIASMSAFSLADHLGEAMHR
jgi:AraC-like DNA-binding protein